MTDEELKIAQVTARLAGKKYIVVPYNDKFCLLNTRTGGQLAGRGDGFDAAEAHALEQTCNELWRFQEP